MTYENRNYAFAETFVEELARSGLRHVCICPGSRSTPAAIAFARHTGIKKWHHLDERSASFFALGIAKSLGEPVAVLSTSGTAGANFHPAVIEARYSNVPLIAITADRPPELWEWGTPQTMDQTSLFGNHAKWSVAMPPPESTPALVRYVRALAARVYATAAESPAGPVHVNIPFRDPLSPQQVPADQQLLIGEASLGVDSDIPYTRVVSGSVAPDPVAVQRIAGELGRVERGVIVCGPQLPASLAPSIVALAERLGYPVLADPLSQVRAGSHSLSNAIDTYDLFLRDESLTQGLAPEAVIRFGAWPTNRPLMSFLKSHRSARHIQIGVSGWIDPAHLNTDVIRADPALVCEALLADLPQPDHDSQWLQRWQALRDATRTAIHTQLPGMGELFEGKLFAELGALLPEGAALFAGNSMPVRDMDTYFPVTPKAVRIESNRGVNGIDGVVSTALGFGATWPGRLVLVIGDVSFYHDMNGLLAAQRYGMDATIIIINNDGGAIFSFLPQHNYPEHFEELFGTPHGLTFKPAADLYGLPYTKADSWDAFQAAVTASFATNGTSIIEVPGDRDRNLALHREVSESVLASVREQTAHATRG
ncbi:MAG: 2-succinyl-5-enolpyruvyl-6-hydroxy-3-cyclohexene-1-carboxylic-acid synthase [Chloroflexi bacterium]|nr:2-succinyl-5-enolpyruvyl-6-hydroxy-3-cyclohexene-1-carboxylic-acid synthase [Chloroflexota bacterium]